MSVREEEWSTHPTVCILCVTFINLLMQSYSMTEDIEIDEGGREGGSEVMV